MHVYMYLFLWVSGMKCRTLHSPGSCCATELHPQPGIFQIQLYSSKSGIHYASTLSYTENINGKRKQFIKGKDRKKEGRMGTWEAGKYPNNSQNQAIE